MGYAIHITRRDSSDSQTLPIALSEWRAVVEQTTGVRLANSDFQAMNPTTAEVIEIQNAGGDAEVFFPADSMWRRVFHWSPSGGVSFRAPSDFEQPTSIIRPLAAALARDLNASLIGDEGEIYD
jgi:hypothetical protein